MCLLRCGVVLIECCSCAAGRRSSVMCRLLALVIKSVNYTKIWIFSPGRSDTSDLCGKAVLGYEYDLC